MNFNLIAIIIIIIIAIGGIIYVLFQEYSQNPIDGKLSEWSEWSACDKACGTGTQSRTRSYTPPQFGGANPDGYNKLIETMQIWSGYCIINDGIILSNTTILNDTILFSKNKIFRLEFNIKNGVINIRQQNTNKTWRFLWGSGKNNTGGLTQLIMNIDGNLIIKDKNNIILWESQTAGNSGAYAELTDDGKFIIRDTAKIIKIIYEKSTFANKIYNRYLEIINN